MSKSASPKRRRSRHSRRYAYALIFAVVLVTIGISWSRTSSTFAAATFLIASGIAIGVGTISRASKRRTLRTSGLRVATKVEAERFPEDEDTKMTV